MKPPPDQPRTALGPLQRHAEGALYRVAVAYVWSTLGRFGVPVKDREDVAQAVLFAAYEKRSEYDPTLGSIAQWLHGFALNFARRYWREHSPEAPILRDEAKRPLVAPSTPEDHAMIEEHRDFLYDELLAKIPFEQRAVVVARDLDELEFRDIARLQTIPLSTAYDRYDRGHAALAVLYARSQKDRADRGLCLVPLTLAQLFEADRPIPDAPAQVAQAIWRRYNEHVGGRPCARS